jgi:hypothetical protein
MGSSLESAAELIARSVAPLASALEASDAEVLGFVAALGWTLPSVPPGLTDLSSASAGLTQALAALDATALNAESGDATDDDVLLALGAVLLSVTALAVAIQQLPDKLRAQLPQAYLDATGIADHIVDRLFDYVTSSIVQARYPITYNLLFFLGLVDETDEDEDAAHFQPPFVLRELHWERLSLLLTDPGQLMRDVYGWGAPDLNADRLFEALLRLSLQLMVPAEIRYPSDAAVAAIAPGVPVSPDDGAGPMLAVPVISVDGLTVWLALFPVPKADPADIQALALTLLVSGDFSAAVPLTPNLVLSADAAADLSTGIALVLHPGQPPSLVANMEAASTPVASGQVALGLTYSHPDAQGVSLLSLDGGSRVEVQKISVRGGGAGGSSGGFDAFVELSLAGGKVVIATDQTDGFLAKILPPDGVEVDFEFGLGWSKARGVYFQGAAGLEADIGLHATVGPFELDALHLAITAAAAGLALETSVTGKGVLGPVTASVERIGLAASLAFGPGNLGPAGASVVFKPPSGLGIVVDAGPVTGGGFITFDPPNGRYSGGIELKIEDIVVKAYGLLDTKLPDGTRGFSFLIIITAEFTPIQLGFGFTLMGVGGLAGINRTMVLDALQAGFRAHAISSILFPDIHNAQKIISDLRTIFPPAEGRYVFGPMVEIGWGTPTLVSAQIGVVLEVPAPIRLAILGLITAALPEDAGEDTVVVIHLEVLGTVDFGLKKLAVDASIYDSRIAAFSLSGDMALRLNWGDDALFVFSMGGLHPQFPPPPAFPKLRRLTLSIGDGDNPRLALQTYLAVTSNTVQFGADLELQAAYGGFSVHGYLAFDALFVISPFSFTTDMRAGVDVRYHGASLCGISLDFTLTGPTPWTYHGTATLHFLFFSVSAGIQGSFGGGTATPLSAEPVLDPLVKALNDARSWSAVLPGGATRGVSFLAQKPDDASIYVHPMGQLTVRQSVVPLFTPITRFGSARPSDGDEFDLQGATLTPGGGPATPVTTAQVTDSFARAQYEDMDDGQKLAAQSYEPFSSGLTLGEATVAAGPVSSLDVHYDTQIIDDVFRPARSGPRYRMPLGLQDALDRQGAGALSPVLSSGNARYLVPGLVSPVRTLTPGFVVTSVDDLTVRYDITGGVATTQLGASTQLAAHLARHPEDAGSLQVMPAHEVTP